MTSKVAKAHNSRYSWNSSSVRVEEINGFELDIRLRVLLVEIVEMGNWGEGLGRFGVQCFEYIETFLTRHLIFTEFQKNIFFFIKSTQQTLFLIRFFQPHT